ncbi:MAG: Crp/Fnr family transcriptional regulator, partial [Cellulosilyticaceae bacterium]
MHYTKIQQLFEIYPPLIALNKKTEGSLAQMIIFKTFEAGDFIRTTPMECSGILLVLTGTIKIEKIDDQGKQMALYELGPGEICHESLSCLMKCESLSLVGAALTPVEVAMIPMKHIAAHMIGDPDFLRFMYTNLYDKFSKVILDKE